MFKTTVDKRPNGCRPNDGKALQRRNPMNNSTMSTGNIQALLALAEQKSLTPERMTRIIASGIFADAFDERADLSNRDGWRIALKLQPLIPQLLHFMDTLDITAIDQFEIDRIKVGEVDGVKVGHVDGYFASRFGGFVEEAQPTTTLCRNKLVRSASFSNINEALGAHIQAGTMSQVWALVKCQGKGRRKKGALLVDGKESIFPVRCAHGHLLLVSVAWGSDGWGFFASPPASNSTLPAGCHVFHRDSRGTSGRLIR